MALLIQSNQVIIVGYDTAWKSVETCFTVLYCDWCVF